MTGSEWLAIAAVLLCAVAVLPGTLGVLMFTHKIAADAAGARYVYGWSLWVFLASAALLGAALFLTGGWSLVHWGAVAVYGGVCVFGFFMHVTFLFRPVRRPTFISLDEAIRRFGPDEEVVGVVSRTGEPYAFVTRLARRPHIVYQAEGEDPFVMTHCILAHSSMAYAMQDRFNRPDLIVTAVLANNLVFYDKSNRCSVIQLHNRSRDRSLPLKAVSTVSVSLKTWQALYPESPVWIREREWRDTFYLKLMARADVIDPASPVMVYPLEHSLDRRLPMKAFVIGVQIGDQTRTYPVSLVQDRKLIHDELAGTSLLVLAAFDGDYIQVFDRELHPGKVLSFRSSDAPGRFVDRETGSEWTPMGECAAGALKGERLRPVPHYNKIFWYVWADFHPGTPIYSAAKAEPEAMESAA